MQMQASGQNLREFCKKIENDINSKIYLIINSLPFVAKIGEEIDWHLDRVIEIRESSDKWLEVMGFPTREAIAAIAKNLIKLEHRLDCLDENLYQTEEEIKEYRMKIYGLFSEAAQLTADFAREKG